MEMRFRRSSLPPASLPVRIAAGLCLALAASASARAQEASDALTLGVRYFRVTTTPEADFQADAKSLASSLRIALDNSKGFKQIVTLDDEQVEQITKLIADSKKGSFNRQLPGNLAEAPDAYVFPELRRVAAVERDLFSRIEVTYTVEMGASAVDPVTRAILFSDKVSISEKRNRTDQRGGAKNVYGDLASKAVDRLAAKLAAFFLKRGRVLRVDPQAVYINLGSRHGIKQGDQFTVHKIASEGAQAVGDTAEEEGLAEFDLDAKGLIEILEVRESASRAKLIETMKGEIKKGDAVRWVKK